MRHALACTCLIAPVLAQAPPTPAPAAQPLAPAAVVAAFKAMAVDAPFPRKQFSVSKLEKFLKVKGVNEDAKPLLVAEFLALPEDQRLKALHPDTAILLVLNLARAAAAARPEEAKDENWMQPVLVRAQTVKGKPTVGLNTMTPLVAAASGKVFGPLAPILYFRRNLPGDDPRSGLDQGTRMVDLDRDARNFRMQSGGLWAPDLSFAPDPGAKAELENWVLARICAVRAAGTWDAPELRLSLLKVAVGAAPDWDKELSQRIATAAKALNYTLPAAKTAPAPAAH